MKDLHGPQTQVVEGAYAIKVSMNCSSALRLILYWAQWARTIYQQQRSSDQGVVTGCHPNQRS